MTLDKRDLIGSRVLPLDDKATELRPLDLRRWDHPFWVLRDILAESRVVGTWMTGRDGVREFRTLAGSSLLWCPRTKEMGFSGPEEAVAEIGKAIVDAFNLAASLK
ncbi:MAG: hypothetical protein QOH47_2499 [Sphingomonadales bacterium]|jgi:hypothetical protein|nr:hypothetical protein [Sphingomonadales bacterium]